MLLGQGNDKTRELVETVQTRFEILIRTGTFIALPTSHRDHSIDETIETKEVSRDMYMR
jgi:hypothetical protein